MRARLRKLKNRSKSGSRKKSPRNDSPGGRLKTLKDKITNIVQKIWHRPKPRSQTTTDISDSGLSIDNDKPTPPPRTTSKKFPVPILSKKEPLPSDNDKNQEPPITDPALQPIPVPQPTPLPEPISDPIPAIDPDQPQPSPSPHRDSSIVDPNSGSLSPQQSFINPQPYPSIIPSPDQPFVPPKPYCSMNICKSKIKDHLTFPSCCQVTDIKIPETHPDEIYNACDCCNCSVSTYNSHEYCDPQPDVSSGPYCKCKAQPCCNCNYYSETYSEDWSGYNEPEPENYLNPYDYQDSRPTKIKSPPTYHRNTQIYPYVYSPPITRFQFFTPSPPLRSDSLPLPPVPPHRILSPAEKPYELPPWRPCCPPIPGEPPLYDFDSLAYQGHDAYYDLVNELAPKVETRRHRYNSSNLPSLPPTPPRSSRRGSSRTRSEPTHMVNSCGCDTRRHSARIHNGCVKDNIDHFETITETKPYSRRPRTPRKHCFKH